MAKEIERKFLVASDDWRQEVEDSSTIRQGYIASMSDRSVRVRILGQDRARLTIKIGRSLMSRDEFEYDIPVRDAEELLQAAFGTVIEKTRHCIRRDGYVWEVDVFSGAHQGLVVAEVEMQAEDEQPALPAWLGQEVTGDERYSNLVLATSGVEVA
ncbi:adenylate cyclase [Xaviernesmea oryzae]|uniref:Adenylate cyclase n=1 Tax=Xaviernesmea oryzae TaxID=464029 RepID=A0A1Q9AZN2_9HYPH|nr:CYTH domain-containing protein [Xaviernesmea oryzae]OLP61150.1 adenylate cyclase [Xaviernesmea oryzae]SEL18629.1 CYTH domain-containing protein [Xaviernesmea oryzae]